MSAAVTFPRGFRAAGATGGIKASGQPDIAIVAADALSSVAGLFTRSRTPGAPVVESRRALEANGGRGRAVVVSSGNANVATGATGQDDARSMMQRVASGIGAGSPDEVLVCSTGVIGVALPMGCVDRGIDAALAALSDTGGAAAATAILTTDAGPKAATRVVSLRAGEVRIGGMAKGAGMIRPDLGTMISVVSTDALIAPALLRDLLQLSADRSFNRISVDGCESTSDSLIALAGGASGFGLADPADRAAFLDALGGLCEELSLAIVRDGEGARRIGRYSVTGARSEEDARRVARSVAESALVRCALHGGDPNFGRIVAAAGASRAYLELGALSISIADVPVLRAGVPVSGVQAEAAAAAAADEVVFHIDLGVGTAAAEVIGSDLGHRYVELNAEYTT